MKEQLSLFETPRLDIKTKNPISCNSVKIEDLDHPDLKKIYKNKYVIHSNGGFHFFKNVPNALPIFKEQIWPWIEVLKVNLNESYKFEIIPRPEPSRGLYPRLALFGENFQKKIDMHQLVCLAFNLNPDPKTHTVVNHINGNKVDFRKENLEWTTIKKNSTGPGAELVTPDHILYEIWKLSTNKLN